MPRQARLDTPGTLHHIMIRGAEGQAIFREDKDRHNFLSRIAEISEDTGSRHEMGVPFAEIARHVGVCTSAVAKAVQSLESGS